MSQFPITIQAVTIAAGASLSTGGYIGDGYLAGVIVPSGWTAAGITFQIGIKLPGTNAQTDGGASVQPTYYIATDAGGNAITLTAPIAGSFVSIPQGVEQNLSGAQWMKVQSGTSGSPVVQISAVTIYLVVQKRHSTNTR